jgi:predicted chitinase
MGYVAKLTQEQKNNATTLVKRMRLKHITNVFSIGGILSVISKESNLIPHSESSYKNTSNDRIRHIFTKLSHLNDVQLNILKADDIKFFNAIYGGMYGNGADEGFKFRGEGYHQLTFEGNYKKVGDEIGVDLVNHPELLNTDPNVSADEVIQFFMDKISEGIKLGLLKQYNSNDINGFVTASDALKAMYNCNCGWGKKKAEILADSTGGLALATSRMNEFVDFVKSIPA